MKEVVLVDAVRTPVGNHGGVFRDVDAKELARTVIARNRNPRLRRAARDFIVGHDNR